MEKEIIKIEKNNKNKGNASIRVCKKCGKFYVVTDNDLKYSITKYNTIPTKCKKCRREEYIKEKEDINEVSVDA